jgi:hypothetical protein
VGRNDRADLLEALDVLDGQAEARAWSLLTENQELKEPYVQPPGNLEPWALAEHLVRQLRGSRIMPSRTVA